MRFIVYFLLIYCCCLPYLSAERYVLLLTDDSSDKQNLATSEQVSIGTDTVRLVLEHLPQYDINIQHIPGARLNKFLETAPGTCAYNRIKTPQRTQKYLFSKPLNVFLSHRIYYLSVKGPLPDTVLDNGAVRSLPALFAFYPSQKLALGKGRSYGKILDQQIAALEPDNKILLTGQDIFYDLQKMLSKQRADFVIAYPDTISNVLVSASLPITSYPISGTEEFVTGHFACYPDTSGINFIYDVDKVLGKLFQNNQTLDAHLNHYHTSDHPILEEYFRHTLAEQFSMPAKRGQLAN